MDKKTYYQIVTVIFGLLAVAHALRVFYGWEAQIAGAEIPLWASMAAVLIAGYLAIRGWQFSKKK
jgi:hypothetical protein